MIGNQIALLQREVWEHRAIYVTPFVIGLLVALGALTGSVTLVVNENVANVALLGVSSLGEAQRSAAITGLLAGFMPLFLLPMGILVTFYSLDAMYAERKDRSILFWRSLPVTDAETVVSKLITAMVLIPLVTVVIIALTQIVVMVISSGWLMARDASPWHLIWKPAPLLQLWLATTYIVLALSIWAAPFVGWYLFVSGYVKRSPLLLAFVPLVVLPMLEGMVFRTHYFWTAISTRMKDIPLFKTGGWSDFESLFENPESIHEMAESFSLIERLDVVRFLTAPGLYVGLLVCGLFVAAAIYVRRYRDES